MTLISNKKMKMICGTNMDAFETSFFNITVRFFSVKLFICFLEINTLFLRQLEQKLVIFMVRSIFFLKNSLNTRFVTINSTEDLYVYYTTCTVYLSFKLLTYVFEKSTSKGVFYPFLKNLLFNISTIDTVAENPENLKKSGIFNSCNMLSSKISI